MVDRNYNSRLTFSELLQRHRVGDPLEGRGLEVGEAVRADLVRERVHEVADDGGEHPVAPVLARLSNSCQSSHIKTPVIYLILTCRITNVTCITKALLNVCTVALMLYSYLSSLSNC